MDDTTKGAGAVVGTVSALSRSKGQATVEDATGREVAVQVTDPEQLEALAGRFDRLVLVTGEATFSKGGRLLSVVAMTVSPWEPAAQVVDLG